MNFHLPTSLPKAKLPRVVNRKAPSRDWLMLLSIAFVALLTSLAWNVWTFYKITTGEGVGNTTPTVAAPDVNNVERARAVFVERAAEVERYRSEYRFVDPNR